MHVSLSVQTSFGEFAFFVNYHYFVWKFHKKESLWHCLPSLACACVADVSFPFSRHGDQASGGENEFLASKKWGEVGRGEQNKKGEGQESGQERNWFIFAPHPPPGSYLFAPACSFILFVSFWVNVCYVLSSFLFGVSLFFATLFALQTR